ncbi:hypothetical protein [Flavobacterium sp. N1718]|uniref:hypothetical protein n=1 Tax=Flavobacterium sp. N1718 TaxID=2986822 RepID=UPI0039B6447A
MDLCQNGVIVEVEIDKKVKIPVDSKFCVKDRGVLTRSIEVTMSGKKKNSYGKRILLTDYTCQFNRF